MLSREEFVGLAALLSAPASGKPISNTKFTSVELYERVFKYYCDP